VVIVPFIKKANKINLSNCAPLKTSHFCGATAYLLPRPPSMFGFIDHKQLDRQTHTHKYYVGNNVKFVNVIPGGI
jgi:hypothetical protein